MGVGGSVGGKPISETHLTVLANEKRKNSNSAQVKRMDS